MFGEVTNPKNKGLKDLSLREVFVLVPLVIFVVWIGVYPGTFLKPMEPSVKSFIQQVEAKKTAVINIEKAKKQAEMDAAKIRITSVPSPVTANR